MLLLKRNYNEITVERPLPVVSGVEILRAKGPHKFSPRFVEGGVMEGWLVLGRGMVTVHGSNGDAVFRIVTQPGYYCSHCGAKLDGGSDGVEQKKHLAEKHTGVDGKVTKSPDPDNPSGYRLDLFYFTELVSAPKPTHDLVVEKPSPHKRPTRYLPVRIDPVSQASK